MVIDAILEIDRTSPLSSVTPRNGTVRGRPRGATTAAGGGAGGPREAATRVSSTALVR